MHQSINKIPAAVVVLHDEQAGSCFRKEVCRLYRAEGYDVFCLTGPLRQCAGENPSVSLPENAAADALNGQLAALRERYRHVLLVGFGAGADLAWQCGGKNVCSSIIACCPSRLQECRQTTPVCPTFLLLAGKDSCGAVALPAELAGKKGLRVEVMDAAPGFWDPDSGNFSHNQAQRFHLLRRSFWISCLAEI